jgi:hypothetical protein
MFNHKCCARLQLLNFMELIITKTLRLPLLHQALFEEGIQPARCQPALFQNTLTLPSKELKPT